MDTKDIQMRACKYKLSSMTIKMEGEEDFKVDTELVAGILIEKDFDNYYFPYFEVSLSLPSYMVRNMQKKNTDIKAHIVLQYGYSKSDTINKRTGGNEVFYDYINSEFYVFLEDSTPDIMENQKEEFEKAKKSYKNNNMPLNQIAGLKLILYNEKYLFNSKMIVNEILTSSSLLDAVVRVLNKSMMTNVLMSPPQNSKAYNELVLLPIPACQQIDRLCNQYGIYTKGAVVFFDFDTLYILDKSPKCTAYRPNEIQKTYLSSFAQVAKTNTMLTGCYCNTKEKYNMCNINEGSISVSNKSLLNDQIYGNNVLAINAATGATTQINSGATSAKNSVSQKTPRVMMTTQGDNTASALEAGLKEDSRVVSIQMKGVNISMLNPNLEFVLSFDSARFAAYKGSYRISKEVITLQKDGDLFTPSAVCIFKG